MKIVIIGAGVAGLSIGWKLARGGAEVTVLDRAQAGRGASWAAAGMIAATAESADATAADAAFCRKSAEMWPEFAAEIEEQSGINISYRKDGVLIAALTLNESEALKARANAGAKFISADEARHIAPMLREDVLGALWDSGEAHVDNRALGSALARAFLQAGGALSLNETVVRFETDAKRAVGARTPFHVYFADAFVSAAGAWTSRIEGLPQDAVPQITPVKGEMISLAKPDGAALPTCLVWGNEVYMAPRHDRLLVGATVEESGFDTATTDAARDWLYDHAVGLLPDLKNWEIAEHWAGLRPRAADGLPVLGASAVENVFVASGQFRNGILFAPAIADSMCNLILNGSAPDIAAFSPQRFHT